MAKIEAQRHLESGNALYAQGKYSEACEEYQKALEIEPEHVDADTYNMWGNALYSLERYDETIEKYLRALEINPYSFNYINWVNTLDKLTKDAKEKAIENFQKTIELKPADFAADAYNSWGNALYDLKKYDEAIEKYKKAIEIGPDYVDVYAYRNWGLALSNLKKYDEAIEKYQRAIEINSKYVDVYNDWGLALHELKKYNEAIANYEKAVEIDSKYIYAYKNWGNALYELKRYDEAIEKYLIAIEIDPKSVNYVHWVNTLDKLKKDAKEKAVANFKKIIELKPPDVGGYAYNNWGNALLDDFKKYEEAIEKYQKAIEIDPNYIDAYNSWGNALYDLKKYDEAIEKYKKAIEIGPDYVDVYAYRNWGLALSNLKKYDEAIEKYQRAIEINSKYVDVYNDWGLALHELKKYNEAIANYEKAVEIDSKYIYAYKNWGNALYELKRYDEAIEKYLFALEIDPESANYINWVKALDKLEKDEKETAVEKFQKAIEPKSAEVRANAYRNWGLALYNFKKYNEAIEKYQKAIKINPKLVDTYNDWGNALLDLKKYEEAIEKYKEAIGIKHDYVYAHYNWGLALANQKKYEEAIKKYEDAIKIDSNYVRAYNNYGLALHELKRYDGAIDKYLIGLEIGPESVNYINWVKALGKLEKDEKETAVEKFQKAIEFKSAEVRANAYYNWGLALYNFKKYNEAIEKYQKAVEIDQKHVGAYNDWGNALLALKKYDEAIEKYKKAIENNHEYVYAHFNWGIALASQKKYSEAIEKYKKALEVDPTYVIAYLNWGNVLADQKRCDEGFEKYQKALEINSNYVDAYFNWGISLVDLRRYDEAIEKYRLAIKTDPDNILAAYAFHNIADLFWRQGKYAESRREWEKTVEAYEKTKQKAIDTRNALYFMYFGSIPHEIFRDFDRAEAIYKEGLELEPDNAGILTKLVNLYLEIMDDKVYEQTASYWEAWFGGDEKERKSKEKQTNLYWEAREAYKKAESILENQELKLAEDASTLLQVGELHLAMEEYDKAEKFLLKALEKDPELASAHAALGIVYTRNQDNQDYKKAIKYFKKAYDMRYKEDLTIQSNLAEAYLKAGDANAAKTEYKKILGIAPFHVESHIGLGEVYSALGEDGDEDMYEKAIYHFTQGLNIAKDKKGSKILKKKEQAAALYSRGYARVKLYEASKTMKDESLLQDALEDFKNCFKNDLYNHKAKRAMEKIEKRSKYLTPQKLPEIFGPLGIFFLSVIVFISSQSSFFIGKPFIFYGKPITLDVGYYVLLTFGSLIFMVAGLYLPQILKLKVGGIELEKSPVEQITAPTTIGISK